MLPVKPTRLLSTQDGLEKSNTIVKSELPILILLILLQIGVLMCAEFTASAIGKSYEVERLHGRLIIEGSTMRSLGIVAKTSRGDAMFPTVIRVPEWVPSDQKSNGVSHLRCPEMQCATAL